MKYNSNCIDAIVPIRLDSVTIGTQVWTSKNLDIDDGGEGIYTNELHDVNGVDLGTQYYYTWNAAIRVANSIEGWHLPTSAEWDTLRTYCGGGAVAGKKLKSTSGWTMEEYYPGTDEYGFKAYPVGYKDYYEESFTSIGNTCRIWSNTEHDALRSIIFDIVYYDNGASINGDIDKRSLLPVRLVKD